MWPFRKKPKPLNPGPINEDWRVGDLAESIADNWFDQFGLATLIDRGDVFKVLSVERGGTWFGDSWLLQLGGFPGRRFNALGFRKVPPLNSQADAEFTAKIRACKPKRVRA